MKADLESNQASRIAGELMDEEGVDNVSVVIGGPRDRGVHTGRYVFAKFDINGLKGEVTIKQADDGWPEELIDNEGD